MAPHPRGLPPTPMASRITGRGSTPPRSVQIIIVAERASCSAAAHASRPAHALACFKPAAPFPLAFVLCCTRYYLLVLSCCSLSTVHCALPKSYFHSPTRPPLARHVFSRRRPTERQHRSRAERGGRRPSLHDPDVCAPNPPPPPLGASRSS